MKRVRNLVVLNPPTTDVLQAVEEGLLTQNLEQYYTCQVCDSSMSGLTPARQHLQGIKHKKAVQNYLVTAAYQGQGAADNNMNIPSNTNSTSEVPQKFTSHLVSSALQDGYVSQRCVCKQNLFVYPPCKMCTGDLALSQHLAGETHNKKMNCSSSQCYSTSTTSATAASSLPTMQHDNPATIGHNVQLAMKHGYVSQRLVGSQILYVCNPCNKTCTGEVSMVQHLAGEAHSKKIRMDPTVLDHPFPIPSPPPVSSVSTGTFTTVQHDFAQSGSNVQSAIKNGYVSPQTLGKQTIFMCRPCNTTCNGEVSMNQHLAGESHNKKIKHNWQTGDHSPLVFESSTCTQNPYSSPTRGLASSSPLNSAGPTPNSTPYPTPKHSRSPTPNFTYTPTGNPVLVPLPSPTPDSTSSPQYDSPPSADEVDQAMQSGTVKRMEERDPSHLLCVLCSKPCTGRDSMRQHLIGKSHQKMQRASLHSEGSMSFPQVSKPASSESLQSSLSTCREATISQSSKTTADNPHDLLRSAKRDGTVTQSGTSYKCEICRILCNSMSQISNHLKGDPHMKQVRSSALQRPTSVPMDKGAGDTTLPSAASKQTAIKMPQPQPQGLCGSQSMDTKKVFNAQSVAVKKEEEPTTTAASSIPSSRCQEHLGNLSRLTSETPKSPSLNPVPMRKGLNVSLPIPLLRHGNYHSDIKVYLPEDSLSDIFD